MVHHSVVPVGCDSAELTVGLIGVLAIRNGYVFLEGSVTYDGLCEGSVATYTPNEEYCLDDSSSDARTCHNGSWSEEVPTFVKS